MSEIIDLTHVWHNQMPSFPGDLQPRIQELQASLQEYCSVQSIHCSNHTGTHLDAPRHFLPEGPSVEQLDPALLWGGAHVLDFTDKGHGDLISARDLQVRLPEAKEDISRLLLYTGWDRRFSGPEFYQEFPALTLEAARYLAGTNLRLLGMDTPSPSPVNDPQQMIHKVLLQAGVWILESLTNLGRLPGKSCELVVAPLPLQGASGAPCRVLARV
ncbi:MAG: cyclase family protein [Thermodesulfobacteriota bacterium]